MKKQLLFIVSAAMAMQLNAAPENTPASESNDATEISTVDNEQQSAKQESKWESILSHMPKFSGYLQTGWNYSKTTADGARSSSSFQAKRLRLIMDGNVGEKVDFRLQI